MSRRMLWGMVLLAATACGGGSSDPEEGAGGAGSGGGAGGSGGTGGSSINDEAAGCLQEPTCTYLSRTLIDAICVEDECLDAGRRDGDGGMLTAEIMLKSEFPPQSGYNVGAFSTALFHPTRPNGEMLRCADLLELDREKRYNAGYANVVAWEYGSVPSASGNAFITPVNNIPVPEEGVEYLILTELFGGGIDTSGKPKGGLVIQGCAEGAVPLPGSFQDPEIGERNSFTVKTALIDPPQKVN